VESCIVKRNSDLRSVKYNLNLAQQRYEERLFEKPKQIKFTSTIKAIDEELLVQDYSPEQVTRTLKKENKPYVSAERIYQYIWQDKKQKGSLYKHLQTKGKRFRKRDTYKDSRGVIKDRILIGLRPKIIDEKARFGDLD
jgi:IS30 family transposase